MSGHGAVLVGSIAIVVVALAGCGYEEAEERGADRDAALDLRIGNLVPLTGELAASGPAARKAAELALVQIHRAITKTEARDRVTLEHGDSHATTEEAQEAARKLAGDGATCLTGPSSSAATVAVAEAVSIPAEILQISPAATADEISDLSDDGLVNRTALPDSAQGPALARAIAADLGGAEGKTVNLGTRNDAYGVDLSKSFADAWDAQGGSLGEEVVYDPDQADYESEAARLVSEDPDAVVIVDSPGTFAKLGPALVGTGLYDPSITWATDGLVGAEVGQLAGVGAVDGMRGTRPGAPLTRPDAKAFNRLFEASRPTSVERATFDAQTFDAVILCYLAAVAAGSTDGAEMAAALPDVTSPGGDRYTWRQLPEATEALRDGSDIDYQGASGPIDLDENGDPAAGTYLLYRYDGGDPEVIGEIPVDRSED
jgi:branched-chain amino acid transport system substrate-binding protein